MAALSRGTSFRRQGSSGMCWAENWTFTDQGMFSGRKVADVSSCEKKDGSIKFSRSNSANATSSGSRKAHFSVIKWLKGKLRKSKS
ncbi:hypothetical protein O6H91_07G133900 [Diphasiastrum complanatum]|uniref:Uncharacterized protein n=1 Tax=Diphasiastrum complanatum TaxID=34168 RepID=A0ACC2DAX5_DIPCM|nr:hypothetical protein O6H91_07G133900 [Diphasiastrum complanatum]